MSGELDDITFVADNVTAAAALVDGKPAILLGFNHGAADAPPILLLADNLLELRERIDSAFDHAAAGLGIRL